MVQRKVIIVGAGGFGRETASLLADLSSDFELRGFVDDDPALTGRPVAGAPVLGPIDELDRYPDDGVTVSVGNPRNYDAKRAIVERLGLPPDRYVTLVHPSVSIGTDVTIGEGTVMLAGSVATHQVRIGRHVGMMPNVVLTHDDVIGDFAILGAGVTLAGGVVVESGAYVGAAASVNTEVVVGAGAMIGMGAVVLSDIPPRETWAGVPARRVS